jgi:hypothetical protein
LSPGGEIGGLLATDATAAGSFVVGGRGGRLAVWQNPDHRLREISMDDEVTDLAITQDGTHV